MKKSRVMSGEYTSSKEDEGFEFNTIEDGKKINATVKV